MKKKQDIQPIDPVKFRQGRDNGAGRTELVWPGKRKEVERVELPFQTIETINRPRGIEHRERGLFGDGPSQDWKNRLIWGDNLLIMGSLLKEYAGKINLIYIAPPFATGDDFSFEVQIGDQEITKEPSALEVKAYRDTWGKGMQSYLQMMYDRLVLMKELLADNGSIYVHCDWRVASYIKLAMDEIFSADNFQRQIAFSTGWALGFKTSADNWIKQHEIILYYSKSKKKIFNKQYIPYTTDYESRSRKDSDGRMWVDQSLGKISKEKLEELKKLGIAYQTTTGGWRKKQYLDDMKGQIVGDIWTDIDPINSQAKENLGYPTQKREELLERIIKASSNKNDLIADFFCGSGTTLAVAEKLGRKWIGSDLGRFAIHTARKRLLDISAKPFIVQNLGKYERHRWVELNGRYINYLKFILEFYHAEPVEGFTNLHGKKDKVFVHIGAVDAPVTLSEIREALSECKENKIKSLDVLGWEWEMGLHDLVKEEAERYGVKLSTFQIPREVMELNVSDPKVKEDIHFYELAYLEVEPRAEPFDKAQGKGRVAITLKDFIIPNPELLPEEVKDKVKNWSDFIDYWAVDWMFNQHKEKTEEDDTFHNMNQRYRTRKEPKLELSMDYTYPKAGKYNVLVKVIDIFGNDTTKLIEVKI